VAQHHDELIGEQAALDAQLIELHRHKATLGMERDTTFDFTKAWAHPRDIVATINHEGTSHPNFARASQNVVTIMSLLDTLPAPSTGGVDKVYHQLRDILGIATEQQAESSL
jgi:hypothetical protein